MDGIHLETGQGFLNKNRQVLEETENGNKNMERCSSLASREMQVKISGRSPCTCQNLSLIHI